MKMAVVLPFRIEFFTSFHVFRLGDEINQKKEMLGFRGQ